MDERKKRHNKLSLNCGCDECTTRKSGRSNQHNSPIVPHQYDSKEDFVGPNLSTSFNEEVPDKIEDQHLPDQPLRPNLSTSFNKEVPDKIEDQHLPDQPLRPIDKPTPAATSRPSTSRAAPNPNVPYTKRSTSRWHRRPDRTLPVGPNQPVLNEDSSYEQVMKKHNRLTLNCRCKQCLVKKEKGSASSSVASEDNLEALSSAATPNIAGNSKPTPAATSRPSTSRAASRLSLNLPDQPLRPIDKPTPAATGRPTASRVISRLSLHVALQSVTSDLRPSASLQTVEPSSSELANIAEKRKASPQPSTSSAATKKPLDKKRKASPQPSTSSAATKKSLVKKRKASPQPSTSSAATPNIADEYYATIRTTEDTVTFLGQRLKKKITKYVCPFVFRNKKKCGNDFTTYTALQKHFQHAHHIKKCELHKPLDTAPNNWRRVQNDNNRFDMTTVKLKLCSLLVGGQSVVEENRQRLGTTKDKAQPKSPKPSSTIIQQNEMAREVFGTLEQQAKELSRIAILFSHLVYFKVYRFVNTNDSRVTDTAFKQKIDWNKILLTFKEFLRATKNSSIPASKTTKSGSNSTLYTTDDTDFFNMCHQYKVVTSYEQWCQNAWNYIGDTFETNFKNNIMVHLYKRLRNWFYFRLRNGRKNKELRGKENKKKFADQVYHTMQFLFQYEKCSKPEMVQHGLIAELQQICRFPEFNNSGRSFFSRLYHDYEKSGAKASKPKKAKLTTPKTSKKPKKIVQDNGPRLLWIQMVPGFVRLQGWIHTTNLNRYKDVETKTKKKRKRKRKRNHLQTSDQPVNDTTDAADVEKPPIEPPAPRNRRRKRKCRKGSENDEAIHWAKLKNFIVVPQHSFGMKHFAIDTKALFDVVKNLSSFHSADGKILFTQNEFVELIKDPDNANAKTTNPFWYYMFKLQALETATRKFGGRITTNSSDVSVQLCRVKEGRTMTREEVLELASRKRKANDSDTESDSEPEDNNGTHEDQHIIQKLLSKSKNLEDISVSGVDLGIRNVAATVIRTWNKQNDSIVTHESNVLHKSKDYHYKAGFHKRRRKHKKILGPFDEKYKTDRQSDGEEPSQKSGDYMKFLRSRLKWFNKGTDAYMQRPIVNMKFEKFNHTQKQMVKMAQEIVGEVDVHHTKKQTMQKTQTSRPKKCHIVFVGDCSTPANSTVKGHRRSPGDKPICRYIRQRPNTIVLRQDEFRTTKNCSRCFSELDDVESSKERLKICTKFCKPAEDSMPAKEVSTYSNKQSVRRQMRSTGLIKPTQLQRKERVCMERAERWTATDKIRIDKRRTISSTSYNPPDEKLNGLWNRDINAARNIVYLGLCQYGRHIDPEFQHIEKNTAFSRPQRRE